MNNTVISQEEAIKKVKDYRNGLYFKRWKGWSNTALGSVYDTIIQQLEQNIISPQQASDRVDKSQLNRYLKSRWKFS